MANPDQRPPFPTPFLAAQTFLRLLDDVSLIQRLLLEETSILRARVKELEARAGLAPDAMGSAPLNREGRLT